MKYDVIISPVNTEKAMSLTGENVYVFMVRKDASKSLIASVVEDIFKVKVAYVNTLNTPKKSKFFKGIKGTVPSVKKAFIKLSEGTINFESGF